MWKQIQKGSTPNRIFPLVRHKERRTVAGCSQGGLLPACAFLFPFFPSFPSFLPQIYLDPGELFLLWGWLVPRASILSLTHLSLNTSSQGREKPVGKIDMSLIQYWGMLRASYWRGRERGKTEHQWGYLHNMNQTQITCQQFTQVFCNCLHCCLFFFKSVLILATRAPCHWHENTEHRETHSSPAQIQSSVLLRGHCP